MSSSASSDDHSRSDGSSAREDEPAEKSARPPGADPPRSVLAELLYRRVPQVLAGYLGVTWTLFELMQWLTEQYLISPYL